MSVFELSIYSPTIEEAWKKSRIGRLKTMALSIKDGIRPVAH
jgi:hypothetical protein